MIVDTQDAGMEGQAYKQLWSSRQTRSAAAGKRLAMDFGTDVVPDLGSNRGWLRACNLVRPWPHRGKLPIMVVEALPMAVVYYNVHQLALHVMTLKPGSQELCYIFM